MALNALHHITVMTKDLDATFEAIQRFRSSTLR